MSSKELLARLQELKIPAKGHSSTLVDAYVDKIRKQLGPEVADVAAKAEEEKRAEQARKVAAERNRRETEAAARKTAAEKERALREAERARRASKADAYQHKGDPVTLGKGGATAFVPKTATASTKAVFGTDGKATLKRGPERSDVSAQVTTSVGDAVGDPAHTSVAGFPVIAGADTKKASTPEPATKTTEAAAKAGAKVVSRAGIKAGTEAGAETESAAVSLIADTAVVSTPTADSAVREGTKTTPTPETVAAGSALKARTKVAHKDPSAADIKTKIKSKTKAAVTTGTEVESQVSSTRTSETATAKAAPKAAAADARDAKTDKAKRPQKHFDALRSQIEAEQSRIAAERAEKSIKPSKSRGVRSGAPKTSSDSVGKTNEAAASTRTGSVSPDDMVLGAMAGSGFAGAATAQDGTTSTKRATRGGQKTAKETSKFDVLNAQDIPGGQPAKDDADARQGRKTKARKARDDSPRDLDDASTGRGRKSKEARSRPASVRLTDAYASEDSSEDDRYRLMAIAAEQLQREKVLAEARAAVEAASDDGGGRRKKRKERRTAQAKERAEQAAIEKGLDPELVLDSSVVEITTGATVQEFADALGVASGDVVKRLFLLGSPLTATQTMSDEYVELIADDMGRKVRIVSPEEEYSVQINDAPRDLIPRPPVVTVMGHVDHGKTSLLDAIRETGVVATEAGGITQHIGASVAFIDDKPITFIDTPGHEAFTAMRARGAKLTDVVVLVVAADDGVMPQTVEAIHHAKAAGVPIVVAVNKIDKPGATPERARQELTEHGIVPEEWGGQNIFVDVSAKQRTGIDNLLEAIILQADVLELKANPTALASGFVIEAKLDKGRGPVATVLVQRGTLRVGETMVVGTSYGRVRALINSAGEVVTEAGPAAPVEILGLNSVPYAGDEFRVFADERDARNLAEDRSLRQRLADQQNKSHVSLEDLFTRIEQDKLSELNLVVKADVQGSIEALKDALDKMDQSEVRINVIHSAVGGISETDVTLAAASDAIVIGFNVRPTAKARQMAEKEKVEIKTYKIIYQAIEEINAARVGMLSPDIVEVDTAMAEVRDLFKVPKTGTVAGCLVVEGEISKGDRLRVVRDGAVVFEGNIASLRRFKEDVKSVKAGYECGVGIEDYQDVKVGDILEAYQVTEVAREA